MSQRIGKSERDGWRAVQTILVYSFHRHRIGNGKACRFDPGNLEL